MKKQIDQVKDFHKKFKALVSSKPSIIPEDRIKLRMRLMLEEIHEYHKGAKEKDLENVAKELADILYTVYGTILEHGLQDKIEDVFNEVHRSNMSKKYNEYKMTKGEDYVEANVKKILGEEK